MFAGKNSIKNLTSIPLLGSRVLLASVIGLLIQISLLVKQSDYLLQIQESTKRFISLAFNFFDLNSQYYVGYNLIGGDKIIVHTFFVLVAYIAILLITLPFRK